MAAKRNMPITDRVVKHSVHKLVHCPGIILVDTLPNSPLDLLTMHCCICVTNCYGKISQMPPLHIRARLALQLWNYVCRCYSPCRWETTLLSCSQNVV